MAQILGIIPSRYESQRLPGKPLIDLQGKTIVQRVYEQVSKSKLVSEVVVATDDDRIFEHVENFGGKAIMTDVNHRNGTERCAEVAERMPEFDSIINIQGDEPFINPIQVDELAKVLEEVEVEIATQAKLITNSQELFSATEAKVIFNKNFEVLYMSRSPIPYCKGVAEDVWHEKHKYYKHIGIYGFKRDILMKIAKLPKNNLENAESLEQLRWLDNYKIKLSLTEHETISIDTKEDLLEAEEYLKSQV